MNIKFKNPLQIGLKNLKPALSKDMLRPTMCHVYVDLVKNRLVATNAHVLVAYSIEITECDNPTNIEGLMLPVEFFDFKKYMVQLTNYQKKHSLAEYTYVLTNEFAEVYLGDDLAFRAKYYDNPFTTEKPLKYPDYDKVLPTDKTEKEPLTRVSVNPVLLANVCDMLPKSEILQQIRIKLYGERKHIIIESNAPNDFYEAGKKPLECFALLMPTIDND